MRVARLDLGQDRLEAAAAIRGTAGAPDDVGEAVAAIVEAVRSRGDLAVAELTERHDGVRLAGDRLAVDPVEIDRAVDALPRDLIEALELAASNVRAVAEAQLSPEGRLTAVELPQGQTVTLRDVPVGAAGVYAPGGRAAYASSVLMCCIPARVAGVERVVVTSPPAPDGKPSRSVLAACAIAGADEVYAVGGAQAIAALAHGTDQIRPVDTIAGPGNRYVVEAKRQVAGRVGIDSFAGPSELAVVFDASVELDWVALDVCAQAEHGAEGLLVAIAADGDLLASLERRVGELAAGRPGVADAPLVLVRVADLESGMGVADRLAPEHLQLMCEGAEDLARGVRTAGCVFVGPCSATAFGDYAAGSNHVLPTGGSGRFAGPLSPRTFMRQIATVEISAAAAAALAPHVNALAEAEGFPVHGESAMARAADDDR